MFGFDVPFKKAEGFVTIGSNPSDVDIKIQIIWDVHSEVSCRVNSSQYSIMHDELTIDGMTKQSILVEN